MKELTIEDLKQTSKLWCVDKVKSFSEDNIYCVKSDIIIKNLSIRNHPTLYNQDNYTNLISKIQKEGWSKDWPATIKIGDKKEILLQDGNHRMNMMYNLKIQNIPFKFEYVENLTLSTSSNIPVFTKDGKDYYYNESLPKWEKK